MQKNQSGQYVYFSLVSAISGNPTTGASGAISGRKSLDGLSGMIVLSGNIIELGGGMYRANLYDFDTNGNQAGYFFTSSGTVPAYCQFDMIDGNLSGRVWLATDQRATLSGINTIVPIASISGAIANSGLFVTVPIATISGNISNSGLTVTVLPATISGVNTMANVVRWSGVPVAVNLNSGVPVVDIGYSLGSGVSNYDGLMVSGGNSTVNLSSGGSDVDDYYNGRKLTLTAGTGAGQSRWITDYVGATRLATLDRAWATNPTSGGEYIFEDYQASGAGSGLFVTVPIASISGNISNSGQFVTVLPATISGVVANSGLFATVLPANLSGVVANSGLFVTVPIASISGAVGNSGQFVTLPKETISGVVANSGLFVVATATTDPALISGVFVTLPKATISGVVANSGLFVVATATVDPALISGLFVTVPIATISGAVGNSGQFVTVLPANLSGVVANSGLFATVLPANLSGVTANSGLFVSLPKETISGVVANSGLFVTGGVVSGEVYPASGVVGLAVLTHNFSGVAGYSGQRNLLNAGRKLVNKFDAGVTSSGYLTVFLENDTTLVLRQAVTSQSGAPPITALDTE